MIVVSDLSYAYDKDRYAVDKINFHVKEGEIFGFLGPNGAGKSTTQKILTGVLSGYTGDVNILGFDLRKTNKDFFTQIGVAFEVPYLYSTLSAVDNLRYFENFYKGRPKRDIEVLLEQLELKKGFEKKQIKSYSKGMRQRVNIARALIHSPKLLFLDEPISGLDPIGAAVIKNIVKEEKSKGTTVFLTTHNMSVADELCDRVAFMVDGKVDVIGEPSKLKEEISHGMVEATYIKNELCHTEQISISEIQKLEYDKLLKIHSLEASLEDVFLKLTGRRLNT
ncbi:MAG: ABC transporter ATP-binding protein [Cellulosilyticaceae bacterium]